MPELNNEENTKDILEIAELDYEDNLVTIKEKYDNTLSQISEIEEIAEMMIKTLPRLNRNKLREELTDMSVEVLQDPTTFDSVTRY